jgi:hypothetical protein
VAVTAPDLSDAGASSGPNASQPEGQALPTDVPQASQAPQAPPPEPEQPEPPAQPEAPPEPAPPPTLDLGRGQPPDAPWRQQLLIWAQHPRANDALRRLAVLANLERAP